MNDSLSVEIVITSDCKRKLTVKTGESYTKYPRTLSGIYPIEMPVEKCISDICAGLDANSIIRVLKLWNDPTFAKSREEFCNGYDSE